MYVNNVREALDQLTEDEFEEYLKRLRLVLRKRYRKNVKPSDLRNRVEEFIGGKDPKIDYFEAYLVTFDELSVNGAINALHNKKIKMPKTWRQLLLSVTEDRTLSPEVVKHLEDEQILSEIKALFGEQCLALFDQKQVRATVTTLTCPFLSQSTCNKGTSYFIVLHDVSRLFTSVEREICESIHRACVRQCAYSSYQDGTSLS